MQKLYFLLLFVGVLFAQCSKKTTDAMVDKAGTEVSKANPELAWRSQAPSAGPARPIQLGEYNSFDLDNGLKVIIVENHKLPRVSYQLSLLNNPVLEEDKVGYVQFAGDLLRTGTKSKSKAEIDEAVDYIGANLSTSGRGLFASSLRKHSGKLLELMTDVLYNPSFPEAEFDKLKTQTVSGLATAKTDANTMASNVASVLNFGKDHPYGEVQTEEHVANITLDKAKEYYKTFFKPNNAYLIIVGDITPAEAKANAEKYFGSWKKGNVPNPEYDIPTPPTGRNVAFANKDGAVQSVIRVTYPVDLKPGDDDLVAARVMNNILGGGIFSGRLMQNLREDKAYTYGARSNLSSNRLGGNFNAYASVRNAVTDSSVTEFLYEMERMVNEPVSADDLSLVKNSMTGSFARSLESPQTIARFARNTYQYNLPKDYYETYLQRLNAVTVQDVQAMAKEYIKPENAYIVVAGSKDDVANNLLKFDSDGKIQYFDAFGNEIEDQGTMIPDGVTAETVIGDYIEAIGGKSTLMGVKSMVSKMNMEIMGQQASMEIGQKDNKKFYMEMSMAGNVMQEQRFDGMKAKVGGMGQSQIITEGDELESMKSQSILFPQLNYFTGAYKVNLKGIEDVNGEKAYKVEVEKPNGDKEYEFYGLQSNFLLKSNASQEGPDGTSTTVTTEMKDYKEVSGVMVPHKMIISGAMPFPLEMNAESIMVNGDISDDKFKVE